MGFRAAVFDSDGILVDTEGIQWQAWNEVLEKFGAFMPEKDYAKYIGKPRNTVARELVEYYKLPVDAGTLTKDNRDVAMSRFNTMSIALMPYAREAVMFFKSQDMKLAVCSGAHRGEAELKLKSAGLEDLFDCIITRSDVRRGKPFPDIYEFAASRLMLNPGECIAFEDTQYGVHAAKAAGLCCIAVPNRYSAGHDFSKADKVVKDLKEAIMECEKYMKG